MKIKRKIIKSNETYKGKRLSTKIYGKRRSNTQRERERAGKVALRDYAAVCTEQGGWSRRGSGHSVRVLKWMARIITL